MTGMIKTLLLAIVSITALNAIAQKPSSFKSKEVYRSEKLIIIQITPNSFHHISYLKTNDFGNVPCNGLVVTNNKEAIVFDTPTNDSSSNELIKWIEGKLHYKINAVIPTHFHDDCLGGLKAFHDHTIPSYAYFRTIQFVTDREFTIPLNSFSDSLHLNLGSSFITAKFYGEGHTRDNVVGYFPSENILFGGCLIKEVDATKGFLGDANIATWSATVEKVKKAYPKVKVVVPGHGEIGDGRLLDYTIKLFKMP